MGGGDGDDSIQMLMKADFTAMLCHLTISIYVIFSIISHFAIYLKHVSVEKFNDEYWRHMQALLDPIVAFNNVIDDDNNEDAYVDGNGDDGDDDAILLSCLAFLQDKRSWPRDLCAVSLKE